MKVRLKAVEANQWFKRGDHKKVLLFGSANSGNCDQCGGPMYAENPQTKRWDIPLHGWLRTSVSGFRVCPGDWIIDYPDGESVACDPGSFERYFEILED